jgi:hypothetical protein
MDENMLRIFERRVLRIVYGPVADNGIWRTGYSDEPDALYNELDTDRMVKIGRWRWLGLFSRMQEMERCRKRTLLKPEGTRRAGKHHLR